MSEPRGKGARAAVKPSIAKGRGRTGADKPGSPNPDKQASHPSGGKERPAKQNRHLQQQQPEVLRQNPSFPQQNQKQGRIHHDPQKQQQQKQLKPQQQVQQQPKQDHSFPPKKPQRHATQHQLLQFSDPQSQVQRIQQQQPRPVDRDSQLKIFEKEIKDRLKKLRLDKDLKNSQAKVVNTIKDIILEYLKRNDRHFHWELIGTGSYYDRSKISKPDEYDCVMLCTIRAEIQYCGKEFGDSTYCALRAQIEHSYDTKLPVHRRCLNTEPDSSGSIHIDPKRFMDHFGDMVRKAIQEEAKNKLKDLQMDYQINDICCPAFTLKVRGKPGSDVPSFSMDIVPAVKLMEWPLPANSWHLQRLPDLERCLRKPDESHINPFVVAKINPCERRKIKGCCKLWKISFSRAEKEIILHANRDSGGSTKSSCPKNVLRLLKSDLEEFKLNNPHCEFSSFHIKTIFLHLLDKKADDTLWAQEKLYSRYIDGLKQVIYCLDKSVIKHYFICDVNLLEPELVSRSELSGLSTYFGKQLQKYSV